MEEEQKIDIQMDKMETSLFLQAENTLSYSSRLFYPQYSILTKNNLISDLGLKQNNEIIIDFSLETLDFSVVGEHPLLISLWDIENKRYSIKIITIVVFASHKKYAVLKNIFWRAYGFVLEGELGNVEYTPPTHEDEEHYRARLIALTSKKVSPDVILYIKIKKRQEKFHFVLENQYLLALEAGNYRIQVSRQSLSSHGEWGNEEEILLFSTQKDQNMLTHTLPVLNCGFKNIYIQTTPTGEIQIIVKQSGNED